MKKLTDKVRDFFRADTTKGANMLPEDETTEETTEEETEETTEEETEETTEEESSGSDEETDVETESGTEVPPPQSFNDYFQTAMRPAGIAYTPQGVAIWNAATEAAALIASGPREKGLKIADQIRANREIV